MSSSHGTGPGEDSILNQALSSIGNDATSVQQAQSHLDDLDFSADVSSPATQVAPSGGSSDFDIFDVLMADAPKSETTEIQPLSQPKSAFDNMFGDAPSVPAAPAHDLMDDAGLPLDVARHSAADTVGDQDVMDGLLSESVRLGDGLDDLLDLSAVAQVSPLPRTADLPGSELKASEGPVDFDDLFSATNNDNSSSLLRPDNNYRASPDADLDSLLEPVAVVIPANGGSHDIDGNAVKPAQNSSHQRESVDFFGEESTPRTHMRNDDLLADEQSGVTGHAVGKDDLLDDFLVTPATAGRADMLDDLLLAPSAKGSADLLDDTITTSPADRKDDPKVANGEQDPLDENSFDPMDQWSTGLPEDDEQLDDILTDDDLDEGVVSPFSAGDDVADFMSMGGTESLHEDVLSTLPTHQTPEDLSDLLDTISSPAIRKNASHSVGPADEHLMSLSSVLSESASSATVEITEKPGFTTPSTDDSHTKTPEKSVDKGASGLLKRILYSVLSFSIMAAVGTGVWYAGTNGHFTLPEQGSYGESPSGQTVNKPPVSDVEQSVSTTSSASSNELAELRKEVAGLSEKLSFVMSSKGGAGEPSNAATLELIAKYDEIMKSQQQLIQEQSRYAALSDELRTQLETYETNMLSRFEKVVGLTSKVASQNAEQAQLIKDSVLREAIAAINAKVGGADNSKLAVLQKEIVDAKAKIEQLSQNVVAQRQVQTVLESEIQDMRESPLASRRIKNATANKTAAKPSGAKVVVDTEPESPFSDAGSDELVLVGVQSKKGGVFDIYVEPSDPNDLSGVVPYLFGPNQSSVIPGYGRILSVHKVEGAQSLVPYVVVTEMGEIRGKR